jgi:tartrate dehydrogenase/decarboxylase/D-malate dehydrogenase
VSEEYPGVTVERLLVDAALMVLICRPSEFNVVVASNLCGDILTDIVAQITGSMGLAPSGNIHPGDAFPSMFKPVHGSAPNIVGERAANPLATVLSWSMLLEDLGESAAADALWDAVTEQLADGSAPRTPDLGGDADTQTVLDDLRSRLCVGRRFVRLGEIANPDGGCLLVRPVGNGPAISKAGPTVLPIFARSEQTYVYVTKIRR